MKCYGQWECTITIADKKIYARQIVLPMTPSENERLSPMFARGKSISRLRNSTKYNRFLNVCQTFLRKGRLPIMEGDLAVFVTEVFPDNRKRDVDNRIKALFDIFTKSEHLITDDSQIVTLKVDKFVIQNYNFIIAFVVKSDDLPTKYFSLDKSFLQDLGRKIQDEHNSTTNSLGDMGTF